MRLRQPPSWSFSRDSSRLRTNLEHFDRTVQYVGIGTTLAHSGLFVDSEAPSTFVSDRKAPHHKCFFEMQLQYFIVFEAPILIHIFILDTKARCGSTYDEKLYEPKPIDRAALNSWIDSRGIDGEYQQLFKGVDPASVQSRDEIERVRGTEPYKQLLKHCRESQNKNR